MNARRLDLAVWLASAAIALSTLVPYLAQDVRSRPGETFTGLLTAIPDESSYLMWMDQHRRGSVLVENRMTVDAPGKLLPNPVWLLLGGVASATGMPLVTAYHLGRVAFAFAWLAVLWALCKAFLKQPRPALLAFGLASLGSGLGWLASAGVPVESADWIPELWSYPSILYFPHFAAALALACGGVLLLLRAHERRNSRRAAAAGGLFLLLALVHPYTAVTLAVALAARFAIGRWRRMLTPAEGRLDLVALAGLAAGLAVAAGQALLSPAGAAWAAANEMPSPPPWQYALGLGVPGALGVAGLARVVRRRAWSGPTLLLVAWVGAAAILAYGSPVIPFERRCVEGVHVAFAILAAAFLAPRLRGLSRRAAAVWIAVLVAAGVPTNALLLVRESTAWNPGQVPDDWREMTEAVESLHVPRTVFTDARRAMHLAAFADVRVFAGHHELTPDFGHRVKAISDFYDGSRTWADRLEALHAARCRYLVLDRADAEAMGAGGPPAGALVASGRTWAIYGVP